MVEKYGDGPNMNNVGNLSKLTMINNKPKKTSKASEHRLVWRSSLFLENDVENRFFIFVKNADSGWRNTFVRLFAHSRPNYLNAVLFEIKILK